VLKKVDNPRIVPHLLTNKIVWEQYVRGGYFVEDGRWNYVEEHCESNQS
jgi:hypothetical protein